jgi:hypothetical protein
MITYYSDHHVLILKMLSEFHEIARLTLANEKLRDMRPSKKVMALSGPDAGMNMASWLTIVHEAGLSQSL